MNRIVVANWKMNPQSQKEAEVLFKESYSLAKNIKNTKIILCPPFPFLFVSKKFKNKNISLGSQNVSTKTEGSYTGEVSPKMLKDMGVSYTIVGHGESRRLGETNEIINQKILNLLKYKLTPILCVGESVRDANGSFLLLVEEQIKKSLIGVSGAQMKNIIVAYEPIWAIGKNATREATKEEFMEMKIFIKKVVSDIYTPKIAHSIIIIYGGSVNPLNTRSFIQDGGADGLLVGRDSINPKKFGAVLSALN
ncbi:MAG: triose-phosphate isomerase [Candidatus Nomurabacteria bacterium]|nr:triose-phosphate isomerase [Candidatus Nomurabacteria bacterium]